MYLDPGFGGMLVQVVVAIVAMGGIIAFSLRRKISALFSKNKKAGSMDTGEATPADTTDKTNDNAADDAIDMLSDD